MLVKIQVLLQHQIVHLLIFLQYTTFPCHDLLSFLDNVLALAFDALLMQSWALPAGFLLLMLDIRGRHVPLVGIHLNNVTLVNWSL
jgi:hypothetical protein